MNLLDRKNTFLTLKTALESLSASELDEVIQRAKAGNAWFTPKNVLVALEGVLAYLNEEQLDTWLNKCPIVSNPKKIGVVMAGNIPMVGVHDLICVLLSGHSLQAKLSSQDTFLMKFIIEKLVHIEPAFAQRIEIVEQLKGFDAVIATGSDNTARYFDYYFGKYPHIIRKNRTSVAVLDGNENALQLAKLGSDIFTYFGLGCRNVTKLYVPENYDFRLFFEAIEAEKEIIHHHKYNNNYDYNKSIFLVNKINHLDNGFLLLVEKEAIFSPISVLHYERYQDVNSLQTHLQAIKDSLQCIVTEIDIFKNVIPFGQAQAPTIADYADGIDTMQFLTNL
jgi:hypothetical protein